MSAVIKEIERYLDDGFNIIRLETKDLDEREGHHAFVWLGDVMGKVDSVMLRLKDEEDEKYVRTRLGQTG